MLNIYCGREHTDREKFIFEHVKGRTLLIVPDQFSLQAERDAFFYLKEKSLMDLRVMDFSTLGHKVLNQVGGKRPKLIDKYGRHMLLTKVVREKEDSLRIYKGLSRKNSFIEMANSMISEMKRYDVTAQALADAADRLDEGSYLKYKLRDILTIYDAYQELIEDKYLDSEDYISFYGEKILTAPMVREAEIWIYGFDTFTPKNLLVIERLMKASKSVNIVMTYEPDNEMFELTKYVMGQLAELAERLNEEAVIKQIDGQRYMRRSVWNRGGGKLPVTLVAASSMYAEADRAASYILKLVREQGYKFGDIVVVCNDTDTRGGILKRTFMRWGIPVFMDRKRKVLHHQAVKFLLALMEAISSGYRDNAIMGILKSGLMEFADDDKEVLENYVKQFRIRGSMWKRPFEKGQGDYDAEELNRINGLREVVVSCIETARLRMGGRNTAGEKVRGLYDFLEKDLAMTDRLEAVMKRQQDMGLAESAAETAQSWNVICGIFDQIVETVGNEKISNDELLKLMTAGFEDVEIGLVPVTTDCVLIGTLQRTRLSRLKALLVVGANEGVLPLDHSDEGLLSQREKDVLQFMDLEISKRDDIVRQEEQLALYRMLCLPEEVLYVSCCGVDEKGEALRPSEVFSGLKSHLENVLTKYGENADSVSVFGDLSDEDDVIEMVTSREGTLSYMADAFRSCFDGKEPDDGWLQVMNWYEDNDSEEFRRVKRGMLFDNKLDAMGEELADSLYRGDRTALEVSASRLERYSGCPFSHFIMYGLKAEEPRIYEMGAREIGDIYHRCLMRLSRKLTRTSVDDAASPWMTITEEQCHNEVREIIRDDASYYREGILVSGKEEEYRTERITEICSRIAWSMIQQVRKGRIKEMRFEHSFGTGGKLPPVKVDVGDHRVLIQGMIDRLDILRCGEDSGDSSENSGGNGDRSDSGDSENNTENRGDEKTAVRIIDYKTGGDSIEPEYFSKGYKLQLMIYMKAAIESSQEHAEPAGVFYFKIKDIDTDADTRSVSSGKEELEKRIADAYRLEGILLNDEGLIDSMDSEISGSSQVIPVKISKKEGGYVPSAGGYLLSQDEFRELYEQVDRQVERICEEIYAGNIEIKPKREKKKDMKGEYRNACKYCGYKSICMFDTSFEGCRYEQV